MKIGVLGFFCMHIKNIEKKYYSIYKSRKKRLHRSIKKSLLKQTLKSPENAEPIVRVSTQRCTTKECLKSR